jgi:hypothetical protein
MKMLRLPHMTLDHLIAWELCKVNVLFQAYLKPTQKILSLLYHPFQRMKHKTVGDMLHSLLKVASVLQQLVGHIFGHAI